MNLEMEKYHEILETSSKVINELSDSTMAKTDEEDNTGVGRTYECSYCKRGFTNAQALGGHMNIHRKDKAKAKQQQQNYYSSSSLPKIPYNNNYNYNNNNININEGLSCYPNPNFSQQMSYYGPNNLYYQSYNSNNNNNNNNNYTYPFVNTMSTQTSFNYGNTRDFSSGRSRLFGRYDEDLGTDLSLRTNSSSIVNHFHQGEETKNHEDKYGSIDLELRLGYDP